MNEEEWQATSDTAELWESSYLWPETIYDGKFVAGMRVKVTERKYRLFASACVRRLGNILSLDICRRAISLSDWIAEGISIDGELETARLELESIIEKHCVPQDELWQIGFASTFLWEENYRLASQISADCLSILGQPFGSAAEFAHCDIIRDLFPAPNCLVTFKPGWLTPDVITFANEVYNGQAFYQMPRLADLLESGGCDNHEILSHCRMTCNHVRGCWVVDSILGKN